VGAGTKQKKNVGFLRCRESGTKQKGFFFFFFFLNLIKYKTRSRV
jgi:hypothetical protein